MEDNEWSFCSLWTEKIRTGCATALVNDALGGDYFFNRAAVSGCPDPGAAAKKIAKVFFEKGLDCHLYDREGKLKELELEDTMYVLRADKTLQGKTDAVQVDRALLPVWIDVFCKSFTVPEWKPEVERVMNANFHKVRLLLSYKGNEPAGCAALYTKNGMTGLYCLGIVSRMRRKGLAASMLKDAIALSENLFLQTLGSEQLLGLYGKAGFAVAYAKKIYVIRRRS